MHTALQGSVVVADEQLRAESKELLFDCGTVALLMSQGEFWRQERNIASSNCRSVFVNTFQEGFNFKQFKGFLKRLHGCMTL